MLDAALLPIEDDVVRLRELGRDDAPAFAEGTRDPAVRTYGHLPQPDYTPESVQTMIERDVGPGLARGDLGVLAIADAQSDEFVGSLVLFEVTAHKAEVGFWIHPNHRGSGKTAAALNLAIRFARASGLTRLTARTVADNPASQKVLTRAGFAGTGGALATAPSGHRVELLYYQRELGGEPTTAMDP